MGPDSQEGECKVKIFRSASVISNELTVKSLKRNLATFILVKVRYSLSPCNQGLRAASIGR